MTVVSNTKLFNIRNSIDYYNPIRDLANSQYYVFTARHTPLVTSYPQTITDSVNETEYQIFEELIFGKLVTTNDVKQMVDRYDWVSGTVYTAYDDADANLYTKNFFTVSYENGAYHVFKCIQNAGGIASTSQPKLSETAADDESYMTADGYFWKYMYSVDSTTFSKFATTAYIPIVVNTSVSEFSTNGSINSILVTSGGNNYVSFSSGYFTSISIGGNILIHGISNGSANTGFYTGSAVYIASGTGAGQVRSIIDYNVIANSYQITVDSAFTPQPDLTSAYQIAPKVNVLGDGYGAKAISIVNGINAIDRIEVISGGYDYTYANVNITGNTGTVLTNSAVARAIISPRGGHGSNILSELNANKVGISVTFANSESNTISTTNDYSTIGILKDPLFANIELTCDTTVGFQVGEKVIQNIGNNTAINSFISQELRYSYTIGNYVSCQLTAASALTTNDVVRQIAPSGAISTGIVINKTGNTIVVKTDLGKFVAASTIFKVGTPTTNGVVNTISAGFTSDYIYGRDASNTLFSYTTVNNSISVSINGEKFIDKSILPSNTTATAFTVNSNAIRIYNRTFANTDIILINKYVTTALLANAQYSIIGTVQSSNSTVIKLTNVAGNFVTGLSIVGANSATVANVTSVNGPSTIFVQSLKLTGTYNVGSVPFVVDDYCQQDTPGANGAYGYINNIETTDSINYDFYLTGVKGVFEAGGKYLQSADSTKIATITSIRPADLVKYSGDILYAENINPVIRANNQSEQVKLVLKFY